MASIGKVVQAVGPIIDVRFENGRLPELLTALEIKLPNGDTAKFSLPNALKVGSRTYDGSAGITITAADLGLS